jgi:hypothetical protein
MASRAFAFLLVADRLADCATDEPKKSRDATWTAAGSTSPRAFLPDMPRMDNPDPQYQLLITASIEAAFGSQM